MRIFDLSLRHKIPLWGSLLIVATALAVSVALMFRAYDDLRQDLLISSESLGHTLAKTLFTPLLHDDLWRAFEIINAPLHGAAPKSPIEADEIFILNPELKVLVASDPRTMPTLSDLDTLGPERRQLAEALRKAPVTTTSAFDFPKSRHMLVATPIAEDTRQLGILVISHGKDAFWLRFLDIAARGAMVGALALAVILPVNWYWGRHMAEPLVELANGMGSMVRGKPAEIRPDLYNHGDELGRLFSAYRDASQALREKAMLEHEMVQSERLAAVGRLAAGIAHEVNNPLGGMLMAIDNLKQRGELEPKVTKTLALLERGLQQVTETIGALLIEARASNRYLTSQDFDDLQTLIVPQCAKKNIQIEWLSNLPEAMALPAGIVRQILINLLLNAVQSTPLGGCMRLSAGVKGKTLAVVVANQGPPLPVAVKLHLFEPFNTGREGGHGLGLWVTYQAVNQLHGQIEVDSRDDEVRFTVALPLAETVT